MQQRKVIDIQVQLNVMLGMFLEKVIRAIVKYYGCELSEVRQQGI